MRHAATQVAFKNCAPFIKRITKTNGTATNDAEDLTLVTSMYNLLEYSSNYSDTTSSLWFYSKDEATNFNADITHNNNDRNFKSFGYKAKLLPSTVAQPAPNNSHGILKDVTVAVLFKYISNF